MPTEIKTKIKQLHKSCLKTAQLQQEVDDLFRRYGMHIDNFYGVSEDYELPNNIKTEGLAHILNCEGEINQTIKDIEKLFLYYNKENNTRIQNFIVDLKEKLQHEFKIFGDLQIGYEYRKDIGFYNIYHNKIELDTDAKYMNIIGEILATHFNYDDNIYFAYDFYKIEKEDKYD